MSDSIIDHDERSEAGALDLSVKKRLPILLSPPSSATSSPSSSSPSVVPSKRTRTPMKRAFDMNESMELAKTKPASTNKRPLRFQCKYCEYKAPSTSLMQNHIYRHTDSTPYACAYCGHKSTTKSTIMVHIELCHPHMEVKIIESRVREQDFYRDLNSSEVISLPNPIPEPPTKRQRRPNPYDSDLTPINGVAISLKDIADDANQFSPDSDEAYETDHLDSSLFPSSDFLLDHDEPSIEPIPHESSSTPSSFKLKLSPPATPGFHASSIAVKESDSDDDSEYLLVYNRPKQYYGSLYEPDKQYACRLCSYTTNHRPSMEDHVFVHTNEKPYKCGYCGEEIFTRYAATYHIKYKHTGMPRNFIQNKADITQYYINRAKTDENSSHSKATDTRRVRVPAGHGKSANQQHNHHSEGSVEHPIPPAPTPPTPITTTETPLSQSPPSSSAKSQAPASAAPDYRFLLAWSYYLATQSAWLSPLVQQQQQQGALPPAAALPTDPEATAKFLQALQTSLNPMALAAMSNTQGEPTKTKLRSKTKKPARIIIKEELNE